LPSGVVNYKSETKVVAFCTDKPEIFRVAVTDIDDHEQAGEPREPIAPKL